MPDAASRPITHLRIDAAGLADAHHERLGPVSVLLEVRGHGGLGSTGVRQRSACTVLAVGRLADVASHPIAARATLIQRPGCVLIPGLVNAHAHLDLTSIGPRPHDPANGFGPWVAMVTRERPGTREAVTAAVERGVELSLAGGTVAVGDISGNGGGVGINAAIWAMEALAATAMSGVAFLEFFALGAKEPGRLAELKGAIDALPTMSGAVQVGLSPHAPYSVSRHAFAVAKRWADERAWRLCTHLAESKDERQLLTAGTGRLRALLESIGIWTPALADEFGHSSSPVSHMRDVLETCRETLSAVHLNDLSDSDIDAICASGTHAIYCPRASAYFGAEQHFGPHRYRDLIARGCTVALGTDSIINLPPAAADPLRGGISVLDEMRLLYRRDRCSPRTLLAMGTINGAQVLGLRPERFVFEEGHDLAGVVCVPADGSRATDPSKVVMESAEPPELVVLGESR